MDDATGFATLTPPPRDLAILREQSAREERPLGESAAENLRNALAILDAAPMLSGNLATYTNEDVDAIRSRVKRALELIEYVGVCYPAVLTPAGVHSLTEFMATLAEEHGR